MNTTQTRQSRTAALAERTRLAEIARTATPRQRKAAYAALEAAEFAADFAQRDHEMAVRATMAGAPESAIQLAARA